MCSSRLVLVVSAAVCLIGAARPARAQGDFDIRYSADGTMSIVNRVNGKSATLPPKSTPDNRAARNPGSADHTTAYDDLIVAHARANNVRSDLIRAVVTVESGFNPYARSPKGALGLMQLMPATARQFNVSNPFDPEQNIRAGSSYLRQLLDRYDGNEELALAAYNAGPGAVDKYGQTIPPYRETQHYVNKVSELAGDGEDVVPKTAKTTFYKLVELIDGREVVTYTTTKPR
jgi:soluble lytic murein transglycosylase-like protein